MEWGSDAERLREAEAKYKIQKKKAPPPFSLKVTVTLGKRGGRFFAIFYQSCFWGTRIRTWTNGSKIRCTAVILFPTVSEAAALAKGQSGR